MTRISRSSPRFRVWPASVLLLAAALACATALDPVASKIGFTLKTRWGQVLHGRFPEARGEVAELGDGRHQVRLQLSARSVEILGHPSYTRLTRGEGFFDATQNGTATVTVENLPVATEIKALAVTLEPKGGAEQPTNSNFFVMGST